MKIKDYIRYMLGIALAILVVACTTDEDEAVGTKGTVQVVGRVTAFEDHHVTSRALKTNAESKISNMSLFIFEEGGSCVSQQYVNSSRPVFVIDRSKLTGTLNRAKIYMLANVGELEDVDNLDELQAYTCEVGNSIDVVPENGFPMMGHMDDVNLTQGNTNLGAVLEIPLTCLYAKMAFNLQVNMVQSVVGYVPSFRLESWEVHNMPKTVTLAESEFSNVEEYHEEAFVSNKSTGSNPVSGSGTLSFSFYLPEHKVEANTWNDYPAGIDDEKQRFKPKRVKEGTKPTFVRIKGSFSNHQGHMQNVSYDIYLGLDNWQDFKVLRNYQYNNHVVIKGITNAMDGEASTISIDHRVNVERGEFTVAMERETLLDCHFEVRPMRVKLHGGGKVVAKVQSGCDWIRLETKNTAGANHCANGKRKYFTTTLMNELSNTAVVTSNEDNCIWAYIDENVDVSKAQDGVRTATVIFNYYADANADVNTATPTKTETYTFAQRYLYPIAVTRPDGTTHTYYIEYYEEYLHDFDSDNGFNQTDDEGMVWGLDGLQISSENRSIYQDSFNDGGWLSNIVGRIINNALGNVEVWYDFYLTRDKAQTSNQVDVFDYKGYEFTQKIINAANVRGNSAFEIKELDLMEKPKSAVEYCYHKNKRNPDTGLVQTLHWYLPSIDEMEEIVKAAYTTFEVFQENFYWSSQPAYKQNQLKYDGLIFNEEGKYYVDNINAARATKVSYSNGVYSAVPSGMSGYFQVLTYKKALRDRDDTWSITDYTGTRTFDEGYDERTKKNRIRAVYKP